MNRDDEREARDREARFEMASHEPLRAGGIKPSPVQDPEPIRDAAGSVTHEWSSIVNHYIPAADLDPDFSDGVMPDGSRVGEQAAPVSPSDALRFWGRLRAWRDTRADALRHVLDAEPFLAELAGIFEKVAEGQPRLKPSSDSRWFEIPGRDGAKGLCVAVQPDGRSFF